MGNADMKIELEIKDAVKWLRIKTVRVDQSIHKGLHVQTLMNMVRKQYPWAKIIDIRVDLR